MKRIIVAICFLRLIAVSYGQNIQNEDTLTGAVKHIARTYFHVNTVSFPRVTSGGFKKYGDKDRSLVPDVTDNLSLTLHPVVVKTTTFANQEIPSTTKLGFKEAWANHVNIKAVRDFAKTFKNVDNNKWFVSADGSLTSRFNSEGITTTVSYTNKGFRRYILKIYGEDKLSFEIKDKVKREFYDATITLVKEYESENNHSIYVHMQDEQTWKIVQITDGNMELIENLEKG